MNEQKRIVIKADRECFYCGQKVMIHREHRCPNVHVPRNSKKEISR